MKIREATAVDAGQIVRIFHETIHMEKMSGTATGGDPKSLAEWAVSAAAAGVLNLEDTWVSRKNRYFYMAVPKAACSKVKMVLQQLEGNPLPRNPFKVHERNTPGIASTTRTRTTLRPSGMKRTVGGVEGEN